MGSSGRNNIFRIRARDRQIGEKLASEDIPEHLKGKPLKIPQFNFTISLENKVRSMFGPPHFAVRARRIENAIRQLTEDLSIEYAGMHDKFGDDPEEFAEQWEKLIESLELDELNDLIEKHNTYYPMEANLQISPDSGAPMIGSVPWKPKAKISAEVLLKQFPSEVTSASNIGEE